MSFDKNSEEGKLIIVSAPSGSGKTTLVKYLLSTLKELSFSVSACSRQQRPGEIHGKDYYYLTAEDFRNRIDGNEFIEWEEVYPGSYYGTLRSELERIWSDGKHVIFDVDVVGGLNLKSIFGERALALFVMAPSLAHIQQRLLSRESETPETLARRLDKAERELATAPQFDAIIMNDDLESAKKESLDLIRKFLAGERVSSDS